VGQRRTLAVAGLALAAGVLLGAANGVPLLWPRQVGGVKAAVASLATLLLAVGWWLDRKGAGEHQRRARDAALAVLGLLGILCWTNLLQWNYPGFGHPSDSFHYYLGSKYFPELRYTRLYACVALADAEAGLAEPRPMRDLASNALASSATVLGEPEASCRSYFSDVRWAAFRHDVDFHRSRVLPDRWARFQQDHGYNATPAWGVLGHALTNTGPASATQLTLLRALDPLLLLLLGAGVVWAFGWRIGCVAAIYWGTNYASPYGWTGGSILRQDWLAATVLGICALRRDRFACGGALLSVAGLLRLFPGLVIGAVALGTLGRMLRTRSLSLLPAERRFAAGAIAALAVSLPLSAWISGPSAWSEFAENSRVHLSTPLANHVGLRTVLSYDTSMRTELARDGSLDDPMGPWKAARRDRFAQYALLYGALVIGFAALVARAAAGQPLWLAAVLGVAWIPIGAELTAYYWSVLLALAFLKERHAVMGAGLCGLSAAGWWVGNSWHWTDQIHVWLSVITVAFCVFTVLRVTPRAPRAAAEAD
jgi:hypothetical protein